MLNRFPIDYPFFNFPNLNRSPASMAGSFMAGMGDQGAGIAQSGASGSDRNSSSTGKSASSSSQEERSKLRPFIVVAN